MSKNLDYQDNIKKIFGIRVASMDTVNEYLKFLSPQKLEHIKQDMFLELLKSKVLQKQKYSGKYILVAIDGTGIQTYDYEPYPGCPFKIRKRKKEEVYVNFKYEIVICRKIGRQVCYCLNFFTKI
jgi:hypothetical protein